VARQDAGAGGSGCRRGPPDPVCTWQARLADGGIDALRAMSAGRSAQLDAGSCRLWVWHCCKARVLGAGAIVAGLLGSRALQRINEKTLRVAIVCIGITLTVGLFVKSIRLRPSPLSFAIDVHEPPAVSASHEVRKFRFCVGGRQPPAALVMINRYSEASCIAAHKIAYMTEKSR
jgi:hypothetical protein